MDSENVIKTMNQYTTEANTVDHKANIIQKWNKRRKGKEPVFDFKVEQQGNETHLKMSTVNKEDDQIQLKTSYFSEMTGAVGANYAIHLFEKMLEASPGTVKNKSDFYKNKSIQAYQEALISMSPNDEYEGMLITRLIVLNDQIMHFMSRMNNPELSEKSIDKQMNRVAKLTRLHNETLITLNKYRRKGEQRVVVQHQNINVENGGQAAVGSFQAGGMVNDKK